MQRSFVALIITFTIAVTIGCSGSAIKNETGNPAGMNQYTAVYVGNLSLDKDVWKDLDLKSEAEWLSIIASVNKAFQNSLKEALSSKKVTIGNTNPAQKQLAITLSEGEVDRGYRFGSGPWGSITTTVTIRNVKNNTIAYQGTLEAKKSGTFSLETQLQKAAEEIAGRIAMILSK
jgi:hypothetical protein